MLISYYLSSDNNLHFSFFYLTHFRELFKGRNTKIFSFVFGTNENFKICFLDLMTFRS